MPRFFPAALVAALVLSCNADRPAGSLGTRRAPIVSGVAEPGFAAVGALVAADAQFSGVAFCTGTLVAPRWVLTAAHCVAGSQALPASQIYFFLGEQTPGGTGLYFGVAEIVPHPDYVEGEFAHALALVRLATAVPASVAPVAVGLEPAGPVQPGVDLTYVGFGETSATTGAGRGAKRSTELTVDTVFTDSFEVVSSTGAGLCYGDSGAPGMLVVGEEPRLVGVTLTNTEDCAGPSTQVRVDLNEAWIESTTASSDCNEVTGQCGCEQACRPDGSCDDMVCGLDCEAVLGCVNACEDETCVIGCRARGTAPAQATYSALRSCADGRCAGPVDLGLCLEANCEAEYLACVIPDDCSLTGGDCGEQACAPGFADRTWCVETAGTAAGERCDPDAAQYPCWDGLVCMDLGGGARCERLCAGDSDCSGRLCAKPIFEEIDEIGVCVCGSEEACNGSDDDCDGEIDEGCPVGPDAGIDEDAGASAPDAGSSVDSGPAPEADPAGGSGCGCTATGSAPSAFALLTLVGLLPPRRRRL